MLLNRRGRIAIEVLIAAPFFAVFLYAFLLFGLWFAEGVCLHHATTQALAEIQLAELGPGLPGGERLSEARLPAWLEEAAPGKTLSPARIEHAGILREGGRTALVVRYRSRYLPFLVHESTACERSWSDGP